MPLYPDWFARTEIAFRLCTYGIETTTGTLKTKRSNDALLLRNLEVCVDTESNSPLWKVHYMRDTSPLYIPNETSPLTAKIPSDSRSLWYDHIIVEPRYNEGPRDWQNWLSIPSFRYTVVPRYNEPLDNEDLSITNDFVYPIIVKINIYEKESLCKQGHPTNVFCEIFVRRSKYCLEFSITWGRLKISGWALYSCTIFEAYYGKPNIMQQYSVRLIFYVIFLLSGLYRSYVLRHIRFRSFAVLCG